VLTFCIYSTRGWISAQQARQTLLSASLLVTKQRLMGAM